jgi:hypothetical protein
MVIRYIHIYHEDVADSEGDDHNGQEGARSAHPYMKRAIPGAREHVHNEEDGAVVPGCMVEQRKSFGLLDEAVGGALYLTGDEDSASEADSSGEWFIEGSFLWFCFVLFCFVLFCFLGFSVVLW